ncbi:uncharacterized protein AMSG_08875 [Thecamonas trahens ATCC 50062]|uniref:t-SNARE coiled-coil homology domain-containing protein n=1 Tax=Thecamonas trahens ATCC 50062 TaxID=461836 RepID=A0A0L0DM76_THETB|nr:hypothetical protein AMSG_08875 [Thecamonas trahens ATCC 50062]KNC53370.1 hypothetical protein AMSG_08875 [Thecamonas trahens ATCC 50062]|eukprot:XP_013754415.1 hypothetical protein AMSG_08875 [Thecamonas trahens ATCC 50062]
MGGVDRLEAFRAAARAQAREEGRAVGETMMRKARRARSGFSDATLAMYGTLVEMESGMEALREGAPTTEAEKDGVDKALETALHTLCAELDALAGRISSPKAEAAVPPALRAFHLSVLRALNGKMLEVDEELKALRAARAGAAAQKARLQLDVATLACGARGAGSGTGAGASAYDPLMGAEPLEIAAESFFATDAVGASVAASTSPALAAQLAVENRALADEVATMVDQVREAERKMVHIHELHSVMASRLSEQAELIDALLHNASVSVANMETGNTELRKYRESSVSYRIYMLAFLIGASFTVLFLHWYVD